jgi:hypothetical protein
MDEARLMWPETDDIPPMGDEPEPPPFAVAAPLDEESYAVWAPGQVMRPMERLVARAVAKSLPPKRVGNGPAWDAVPSGIGLDCCEESRDLNRCGLRYYWLLGTCLSCDTTEWTAQPRGWSGPVRPPFKKPEPEPLPSPVELGWTRVYDWQAPGYFNGWVCGDLSVSFGVQPGTAHCLEIVAKKGYKELDTWGYDTPRELARLAPIARRYCSRFAEKEKTR